MEDVNKRISETVRTVRGALGQSETKVAKGMGMSHGALNSKIVNRVQWKVEDLAKLAKFWNCEVIDLLQGPLHALNAVIGKAPRQRDRASAA